MNNYDEENKKEYLKDHTQTRKALRFFGWLCLLIGGGLTLVGTIDFFFSMDSMESPSLFFLCFIGLPILAAGIVMLNFGYMKAVNEYTASQSAPVQKDVANYMLDGTREELTKTVNSVSGRQSMAEPNICAKCGEKNPSDAKFCSRCGSSIIVTCPHCGYKNDDDANFCNNCGERLK